MVSSSLCWLELLVCDLGRLHFTFESSYKFCKRRLLQSVVSCGQLPFSCELVNNLHKRVGCETPSVIITAGVRLVVDWFIETIIFGGTLEIGSLVQHGSWRGAGGHNLVWDLGEMLEIVCALAFDLWKLNWFHFNNKWTTEISKTSMRFFGHFRRRQLALRAVSIILGDLDRVFFIWDW
jgi:hypothetical protein